MTMKAVSTVPSGIVAGVGLVVALYCSTILLSSAIFDSAALLALDNTEERRKHRHRHRGVPLISTTTIVINKATKWIEGGHSLRCLRSGL
jgi:hypothetical protein